MSSKKCGLCDSTENLTGPYAGGSIAYYCENCKKIIDRYLEARRKFEKFWRERRKETTKK
jgi:hypothetical protein